MFEAAIFDWDGTLADTRRVVVASFQKALRDIQCEISGDFIEKRIGIGAAETFREILRRSNRPFDEALIRHLVAKKIQNEIDLSADVRLFDGALALLEQLRGRVKLGLASMNDREVIEHLLKTTNTQRFFDAVLTAADVARSKPDPEIFLKCASKLGVSAEKCVVFEDSIFGVKAAKAARMGCVAVTTGVYPREALEKEKPDLVVASLSESGKILSFIFQ
ncbi:MAG: HAD family phosphatase [Candidatus Bathyarchaeota archaeon]|nr:HAD family phosphatase [Candidatus Bathyarchaeota archaeon]